MTDQLLFERRGPIAWITLNRPANGNAITLEMARALMLAAIDCDEDAAIRCVVLTGAGRLFCAGGDVGDFAGAGERIPHFIKELTSYFHSAISRLARMEKPLLTAINGPAAGAGLSLAILGDIAIARRSAHFSLAYTALGLSPDGGSTWLLPRLVGLRRAQELALTGERKTAEEAAAIDLITRAVDDDAFDDEIGAMADRLARSATGALGRTRNLLLASFTNTLETHMEAEARSIAGATVAAEGREGVAAFKAKRAPQFLS